MEAITNLLSSTFSDFSRSKCIKSTVPMTTKKKKVIGGLAYFDKVVGFNSFISIPEDSSVVNTDTTLSFFGACALD